MSMMLRCRVAAPVVAPHVGLWPQASLSTAAKPGKAAAVARVRGTRDLLPEDAEPQQRVVQMLQQTVQRYGFRPVCFVCSIACANGLALY